MSSSRIIVLATIIEQNTRKVDDYLREEGLPSPSFEATNPPDLPLPPPITEAKQAVLEAMDELEALMLGPMPKIFNDLIIKPTSLASLHATARWKLTDAFPVNKQFTASELVAKSGMDEAECTRIIRHGLTNRLFIEPSPGVITHSAMTAALAQVPLLREWMEQTCEDMWSSGPRIVSAMERWPGSEEPNQTAYNLARNTDVSFFDYLAKDETGKRAKLFADSMTFFQSSPGLQTHHIVDQYNWGAYKSVVDVGGSLGAVSVELAKQFPDIRCTVQDLPEVIAAAPKDVDRVEFEAYNFFTPQTVKEADVYLFRMIFHNWGDKYCIDILRNLIPALKNGAHIVINDHVVPEPGTLSPYQDRSVRAFDLVMKACFNAKERDMNDWRALLSKADERFVMKEVKRPEGSQLQIIDVEWKGQ